MYLMSTLALSVHVLFIPLDLGFCPFLLIAVAYFLWVSSFPCPIAPLSLVLFPFRLPQLLSLESYFPYHKCSLTPCFSFCVFLLAILLLSSCSLSSGPSVYCIVYDLFLCVLCLVHWFHFAYQHVVPLAMLYNHDLLRMPWLLVHLSLLLFSHFSRSTSCFSLVSSWLFSLLTLHCNISFGAPNSDARDPSHRPLFCCTTLLLGPSCAGNQIRASGFVVPIN